MRQKRERAQSASNTNTQEGYRNRETKRERARGREAAGGRQRDKVENRKSPSSSSSSKEEASRKRYHLSASLIFSAPLFFPPSYTHPSIYSMQHASTHPSFLPSTLLRIICTSQASALTHLGFLFHLLSPFPALSS